MLRNPQGATFTQKLATLDGWITGQRKDQSPGTRNDIPVVQSDEGFSGPGKQLIKYNPLPTGLVRMCGIISV